MAETQVATNYGKVGAKTSEFFTTLVGMGTGIMVIVASLYQFLQTVHEAFPSAPWLTGLMTIVGGIVTVASTLGFNKGRAVVKASMAQVDAAAVSNGQAPVFAQQNKPIVTPGVIAGNP